MKRGIGLIVLMLFLLNVTVVTVGARDAIAVNSPFVYSFSQNGILYEAGSDAETSSPYFWLNSGAKLIIENGAGRTIQGNLLSGEKWRLIYYNSNPLDTDNGYHPQNIFRLLTRQKWKNVSQEVDFKITKDQLSSSPNRQGYNGILLMSRYLDGNNLYYAGLRTDGAVVIKKKLNGNYYTLGYKKVYPGTYDRLLNPNLIPKNRWIGIKSEVQNVNGKANIKLYLDDGNTGKWTLILDIYDDGIKWGKPILNEGVTGIRTDFMDVEFDNYKLININ